MTAALPRRWFLVRGPSEGGSVALTFDDGPHPVHTPRLLDVLRDLDVRATFFVVGREVEQHPEIIRRMAAEGHAIGHHTFWHADPGAVSARQLIDEVLKTDGLLSPILGRAPRLFRPPHGKLTPAKLLRLWGSSRSVVLWNADPKDFSRDNAKQVLDWFRDRPMQPGDVVLMHDNVPHSIEALPQLVEDSRRRGLSFITVPDWIGRTSTRRGGNTVR